jgi:hypothetical protein
MQKPNNLFIRTINDNMKLNKRKGLVAPIYFLLLLCFSGVNLLSAQETVKEKNWHFLTDVYLMFPYMDGETGFENVLSVPIDANPGDIFNKLKMAAMLYLEASNDKWAITSDLVYMNLNQEVTPGTLLQSGTAGAKQLVWEVAGLYRILPFFEVGAGGRLNNLQTEIDVRRNVFPAGTELYNATHSDTWFDPILITRLSTDINDKWLFQFRGDVGGFGLGSDLSWQLQAYAGYRFSKVFQLTAGYRVLSTDYTKGTDSGEFVFHVKEFGPVIRFGFRL